MAKSHLETKLGIQSFKAQKMPVNGCWDCHCNPVSRATHAGSWRLLWQRDEFFRNLDGFQPISKFLWSLLGFPKSTAKGGKRVSKAERALSLRTNVRKIWNVTTFSCKTIKYLLQVTQRLRCLATHSFSLLKKLG